MKRGFTLLEIIVVMAIVGVLVGIAVPGITGMIIRSRVQDAQNNLLSIYAAQINRNARVGSYCVAANGTNMAALNACLGIAISNSGNINYSCVAAGASFTCTATHTGNPAFAMTLNGATAVNLTGVYNAAGRNPSCANVNCF